MLSIVNSGVVHSITQSMNPNREELLFQLALTKPADERAEFLDRECRGDAALRARLDALLAAHEQPNTLLDTQADAARPTIKIEIADAPDEAVGQTLGRYKLLERIGEGGCGVVYVAEQTEPVRRRVALKVIKLGMDTKQVVVRFEAEQRVARRIFRVDFMHGIDGERPGSVKRELILVGRQRETSPASRWC